MTETRVGLLHKIISCLPQSDSSESLKRLRSFYLMRCKELTVGYGLPVKYFSQETKCPRCCLDWTKETNVKIIPKKLSQKQRIKTKKTTNGDKKKQKSRTVHLQGNEMEQTCSFCKNTTNTTLPKYLKHYPKLFNNSKPIAPNPAPTTKQKVNKLEININKKNNVSTSKKNISDLYINSCDAFSLKNKQNTLASTIKEPTKMIKNNKKKKDKFAGLCQKAVLASAKLKQIQEHDKNNSKLNLFLKPSTG